MNLGEIEQRVAALDTSEGFDLIYDLLLAYGLPKASIARLRNGSHNRSDREDERLWKGKVYYRHVGGADDLHDVIDDASTDARILKERPRFLIVRDSARLLALDTRNDATLDTTLTDLPTHFEFFLPWAGIEKTQLENLNYADVKAAEKMARLYDEIIKHNQITTATDVHHLNVFFSRLLFCFFAEDTQVFEPGQFTNTIASMTNANGEDVNTLLDDLFQVLNTEPSGRARLPSRFRDFGYVNGNLFDQTAPSPIFSAKARKIVLECGTLDWSQINPDIFGSMIQAVVHPSQRETFGMHYTSVENIMKVIRPLFLDELDEAFESSADSLQKLKRLLTRVCAIKVFDPACGSGNFLVIAYKELRKLEHRILQRISELDASEKGLFSLSRIKLENFCGIEIDDFAHEIAILSLWLAKHQMNVEFHELFGVEISLIPLKDTGHVVCGNATRLDWDAVCSKNGTDDLYVLGNPPYLGSSMQGDDQKQDFIEFFGTPRYSKNLDYIALWFLKGADYISDGSADLGFVSTNSVCQGDHVGLMWPLILRLGVKVCFAHESFLWSNQARGNAGVTCVVIGLSTRDRKLKSLYSKGQRRLVANISPYLIPTHRNTIVTRQAAHLWGLPEMLRGNQPTDGGHLIMSEAEVTTLLRDTPTATKFVKKYLGGEDFLKSNVRYCLWIRDDEVQEAMTVPFIKRRLELVQRSRNAGSSTAQAMSDRPHRFLQRPHKNAPAIAVPAVSSQRRNYVPLGFLDEQTVVSNLIYVVYDAAPWVFGLLQSRMHMVWMRAVAGRMKTDYRYSNTLVYNTFPVPELSAADQATLTERAFEVLDAREQHSSKTLAELYVPDGMPDVLSRAHERLDDLVDQSFRKHEFNSDEERLDLLFEMYEKKTAGKSGALDLA